MYKVVPTSRAEGKWVRKELNKLAIRDRLKVWDSKYEKVGERDIRSLWQVNLLKGVGKSSWLKRILYKCVSCSWSTAAVFWVAGNRPILELVHEDL